MNDTMKTANKCEKKLAYMLWNVDKNVTFLQLKWKSW